MGVIRLLLAIAVVSAHTSKIFDYQMVKGQIAVQLFYIISGFYMSMVLNEKYIGNNSSYKIFITNRFLRLYPIYWVVLLLSFEGSLIAMFFGEVNLLTPYTEYLGKGGAFNLVSFLSLIVTHIILFGQDIIMFLGINPANGNFFWTSDFHKTDPQVYKFLLLPQAWTIGIELLFYIVAPFILRKNVVIIGSLILVTAIIRIALIKTGFDYDPWSYRFFPTELMFFFLGYMSYRIYVYSKKVNINNKFKVMAFAIIIFYTIFYKFFDFSFKGPMYYFLFIVLLPFIFSLTKNNKIDAKIGEYSYPVYISHILVLFIIQFTKLPILESIGTSVCIYSIGLSFLLNKYVAEPIDKYRQSRLKTTSANVIIKSNVNTKAEIIL